MWGFTGTLMTSPESRVTSLSSQDLSKTFSGLRSVWMSFIECRNSIAWRQVCVVSFRCDLIGWLSADGSISHAALVSSVAS